MEVSHLGDSGDPVIGVSGSSPKPKTQSRKGTEDLLGESDSAGRKIGFMTLASDDYWASKANILLSRAADCTSRAAKSGELQRATCCRAYLVSGNFHHSAGEDVFKMSVKSIESEWKDEGCHQPCRGALRGPRLQIGRTVRFCLDSTPKHVSLNESS